MNCVAGRIGRPHETSGVAYLEFDWTDSDDAVILDKSDATLAEVCSFVAGARRDSGRVLIHSSRGHSRSCCLAAAWLMKQHHCGLRCDGPVRDRATSESYGM